ncbi:hypothetical protein Klosneuvirus_3_236 [Klosneuvirus KNV1]|uniref:Uncharacterized protein n=1 Tax=Klosneuvirus KNV1 TaxID=1977640 RepID=A0A1V0SKA2_9VIRU|nr:hypothetical protein Klosneuvirus_3_236 [Klosneuvirus KNV1]
MDSQELETQHHKDKKTITTLSIVVGILVVILLAIIIGIFYFYSRLREPIQELIKQGKMPPEFVMKLIFKD